jgi:hypothetical protein
LNLGFVASLSLVPDLVALWESGNASRGAVAQQIFAQPPLVSEERGARIRIDEDAGQQFSRAWICLGRRESFPTQVPSCSRVWLGQSKNYDIWNVRIDLSR